MQKRGLFEIADGGTVFLDEVAEMAPASRRSSCGFWRRRASSGSAAARHPGGPASHRGDQSQPRAAVAERRFRSDLFFRLNVLPIALPPLRSSADDIALLVEFFIDTSMSSSRNTSRGHPGGARAPQAYRWPGNVRELRNVDRARHAAVGRHAARRTRLHDVDEPRRPETASSCRRPASISRPGTQPLIQALERSGWNQAKAGTFLGLNRDQIRYRIDKFGLTDTPTS